MNSLLRLLPGPELLWVIFFLLTTLLVRLSGAPQKGLDDAWIRACWIVPFVCVPLTFALWYVPAVERSWLLLRVWIACLVGGNYVLDKALRAHSEQGPGVGTAYMLGMGLIFFVLIGGSIWYAIKRF